jgi:hypothetical protein
LEFGGILLVLLERRPGHQILIEFIFIIFRAKVRKILISEEWILLLEI